MVQKAQKQQHEASNEIIGGGAIQFLTFELNSEPYGVDILHIREIIDYKNITQVPMMPQFIAGVINLRGSVVPIVDLALRFSLSPSERTKKSSIVIIEVEHEGQNMDIGITVDEVNEVLDISANEIEPTPSFGTQIRTDFIRGMGKVKKELLTLLAVEHILSIDELSLINSATKETG